MAGAGVLATSFLLLATLLGQVRAGAGEQLHLAVTRRHPVDTFSIKGVCGGGGGCLGNSMGTALSLSTDGCTCACAPHLPVFREDIQICVDDLHDCPLIPFVSGTTYQKIPYVYLPLKGQIIYPSAELVFSGTASPLCVVSTAQYLTSSGWKELSNKSETEPPFRLFRDEGRTFLQWLGEGELRRHLEGRLLLVHLVCREPTPEPNQDNSNIFTSCVSFRVAGTPSEINANLGVKEVAFSVDSEQNTDTTGSSYAITAVCSVLLGLVYIVSVLVYLQGKKRKIKYRETTGNSTLNMAEEGIVKNNPLLKHCHENVGYLSDPPSGSESEEGLELNSQKEDARKVQRTSAIIHPCVGDKEKRVKETPYQFQDNSSIERLPEENVSIIETLDYREERPETVRAIACPNARKKLYFNPAYFEPELLMAPPPAAIEFLTKIREVISIAKAKMEAKRFLPSLMGIPEEMTDYSPIDNKTPSLAGTESTVILKTDYTKHKLCRTQKYDHPVEQYHTCCGNSVQKQTSIRKWLENIPIVKTEEETSNTCSKNITKINQNITNNCIKNEKQNMLYENNAIVPEQLLNKKEDISIDIESAKKIQNSNRVEKMKNIKKPSPPIPEKNSTKQDSSYLNVSKTESTIKEKNVSNRRNNKEDKLNNNDTAQIKSTWKDICKEDIKDDLLNQINSALTTKHKLNVELNNNEHDYETIMLQKQDDTQSLPDFIGRTNVYNLVSEVYVNDDFDNKSESNLTNSSSSDNELEYDRNSRGHLTIRVKDSPPLNYANDSDGFEPDTLDRKPNKLKINQEASINIETQDIFADSLERPPHISLKSSGTFKNENLNNILIQDKMNKHPLNRAFGSLREIFEAKTKFNQCTHNKSIKNSNPFGSTKSLNNDLEVELKSWRRGKPKLLRPEARQAKRQRDPSPPNNLIIKPPISTSEENLTITSRRENCPPLPPRLVKPPLPPKNGSVKNNDFIKKHVKSQGFIEMASESSEYEPLSSQECCYQLHTAPLNPRSEFPSKPDKMITTSRAVQNRTEDSGYLSTDSNCSKQEDSVSETDDSFFDGASESGAESIATDSFFFGKTAKYRTNSSSDSPTDF